MAAAASPGEVQMEDTTDKRIKALAGDDGLQTRVRKTTRLSRCVPLAADVAVLDIATMYTLGDELGRCAAPPHRP
tara:strand:- start:1507 stop:1731 length:225 start_codon:yes stop_codon:yes gene_type:complete